MHPNKETQEALEEADKKIINMIKVSDMAQQELKYDKDFEKNCIILNQFSSEPVERATVRKYFTLLEHYNDSIKHGRAKNKI